MSFSITSALSVTLIKIIRLNSVDYCLQLADLYAQNDYLQTPVRSQHSLTITYKHYLYRQSLCHNTVRTTHYTSFIIHNRQISQYRKTFLVIARSYY